MRVAVSLALILLAAAPLGVARAQGQAAAGAGTAPAGGGRPSGELPPPYITRQAEIEVPFSVKASTDPDAQPASVRIYVSWDTGATWHLYQEKRPEEGKFRFRAKQDGEFWFATQTVDGVGRSARQTPTAPQLRLVLDTQTPDLQLTATPSSDGKVTVTWSATDTHLNATTLKIEYQSTSGRGPWQTVVANQAGPTAPGQSTGKIVIQPVSESGAINLRAEISDVAGNVAYASRRVTLARPAAGAPLATTAPHASDTAATPWPADGSSSVAQTPPADRYAGTDESMQRLEDVNSPRSASALPQHRPVASSTQPAVAGPPSFDSLPPPGPGANIPLNPSSETSGSDRIGPALVSPRPGGLNATPANSSFDVPETFPLRRGLEGPSGGLPTPAELPPPTGPSDAPRPGGKALDAGSSREPTTETLPSPTPATSGNPARSPEPIDPQRPSGSGDWAGEEPLPGRPRMTNTRRFSLEYDVEAVGPEGLADVELWGTTDGGTSWTKWGSDPDKASPFDVEVNGEGVFGYRVVIVGRNGLASNTPRSGDSADIWVGVDQTKPSARLTAAAYGSGAQAGKLDIRWEAGDTNLASRPITLSIAPGPEGPFTPIAAGLPNTGQYLWDFDPRSPRQIYLRLEVRDEAGNMTIDQLVEPIRVEGLAPKGRIRGFAPAAETGQQPFRSPLFR